MQVSRFGVSMEQELVDHLDRLVDARGYANRSEAIRAMVRRELVGGGEGSEDQETAALISLVYPYGVVLKRFPTGAYPSLEITANLQLHLRGSVCLKLLVVQGTAADVRTWARALTSQKGVTASYQEVASEHIYSVLGQAIRHETEANGE